MFYVNHAGIYVPAAGGGGGTAVRSSSINASATGTALSVSAPTGTAIGDLVCVIINCNTTGAAAVSDNNGATPFTNQVDYPYDAAGGNISMWSRVIQSGDPTTYNFTQGSNGRWTVIAVAIQDPHATPFDGTPATRGDSQGPATTASTADGVMATAQANTIVFHCMGNDGPSNTITSTPGGFTVAQNGGNQAVAVVHAVQAVAGGVVGQSFTWTNSNVWGSIVFGVRDSAT